MPAALAPLCAGVQQRLVAALREYRMLHMRGMGPGIGAPAMGSSLSPNSLVLPERLKSLPLLVLGACVGARHAFAALRRVPASTHQRTRLITCVPCAWATP